MAPKSESSADNLFRWLGFFIGWLFTGIIGLFAILIDMISSAYWNRSIGVTAEQLALEKQCHSACNFDPLSRGIGVQN
ncbi:MAG: hypothetical protein WCA56_03680 [Xanthobacteraceae bacterium]